ncbi:MAG: hypothetical protein ACLGIC_10065 [Acidimicrobiia bacterium]
MPWLRRRRTEPTTDAASTEPEPASPEASAGSSALVPLVPAESLERTERALRMLAAQSAQLHGQIVQLEHRVDSLADALLDRLDVPTHDDVLQARMHSAKVAAELSRLEVNLAARLDAVRAELRAARGVDDEVDLRDLAPTDTGWAAVG